MCWNAEVSLQSFIVGLAAIGYGAYIGISLPVLFFCFTIVAMQFIEYIVWSNYDDEDINRKASISAATLLWLQPIASILLLPNPTYVLMAYITLSIMGHIITTKQDYSMKRAENGHLAWNFLEKDIQTYIKLVVYFIFLFTPILLTQNKELLAISIALLSFSVYSYWKSNTWGSMWCWLVNGIVLFVVGSRAVLK